MALKVSNPFIGKCRFPTLTFDEREFVHYMEVERVSKDYDPKKPHEFLIERSVEEYERIPIDDHVRSLSSKVGLKNELKGIVTKQQMDEFIETHKAEPGFVDLTKLPDTALSMGEYAVNVDKIWEDIPSELRGDMSKEEFLKTITAKKIQDYVLSKIPKEKDGE